MIPDNNPASRDDDLRETGDHATLIKYIEMATEAVRPRPSDIPAHFTARDVIASEPPSFLNGIYIPLKDRYPHASEGELEAANLRLAWAYANSEVVEVERSQ